MNFAEFQATRHHYIDLSFPTNDGLLEGRSGFAYKNGLYICDIEHEDGKYWLIIGRMEFVSNDLESLEKRLFGFAVDEGYIESEPDAICRKWVEILGDGFHPDTRGADYINIDTKGPTFTKDGARDYDRDMRRLFAIASDPYEHALMAVETM